MSWTVNSVPTNVGATTGYQDQMKRGSVSSNLNSNFVWVVEFAVTDTLSSNGYVISTNRGGTNTNGYAVGVDTTGKVFFQIGTSGIIGSGAGVIQNNIWYTAILTKSGTAIKLFYKMTGADYSYSELNTTSSMVVHEPFMVGKDVKGNIRGIEIFNGVVTDQEAMDIKIGAGYIDAAAIVENIYRSEMGGTGSHGPIAHDTTLTIDNTGLKTYLPMGNTLNDTMAYANGTATGAFLDNGRKGFPNTSYRMENGDYITVGSSNAFSALTEGTIMAWIKADTPENGVIFHAGNADENNQLIFELTDGYDAIDAEILYIRGTGEHNSTTVNDYSNIGYSFTVQGQTKQVETYKLHGKSSYYFDGTTDSIYLASAQPNINPSYAKFFSTPKFIDENWTMDLWINLATLPTTDDYALLSFWYMSGKSSWKFYIDKTTHKIKFDYSTTGSDTNNLLTSTTSVQVGQWMHVAITRNNDDFRLFVDGVVEDSDLSSTATFYEVPSTSGIFMCIGRVHRTSTATYNYYHGYMDDIRISKGAKWTAAFAPYTPDNKPTYYTRLHYGIRSASGNVDVYSNKYAADKIWNHVAITIDADGYDFYINGTHAGGGIDNKFFDDVSGTQINRIGYTGSIYDSKQLLGNVSEFTIFTRKLNHSEIKEIAIEDITHKEVNEDIVSVNHISATDKGEFFIGHIDEYASYTTYYNSTNTTILPLYESTNYLSYRLENGQYITKLSALCRGVGYLKFKVFRIPQLTIYKDNVRFISQNFTVVKDFGQFDITTTSDEIRTQDITDTPYLVPDDGADYFIGVYTATPRMYNGGHYTNFNYNGGWYWSGEATEGTTIKTQEATGCLENSNPPLQISAVQMSVDDYNNLGNVGIVDNRKAFLGTPNQIITNTYENTETPNADFELVVPRMWSDTNPRPYTITATSSDYSPFRAFDNSETTYWQASNNTTWPKQLTVDLGRNNEKVINSYQVKPHGVEYARNWKLQGSNDNTNWVDLHAEHNRRTAETTEILRFPNNNKFRYYRFLFFSNGTNETQNYVIIKNINLYYEKRHNILDASPTQSRHISEQMGNNFSICCEIKPATNQDSIFLSTAPYETETVDTSAGHISGAPSAKGIILGTTKNGRIFAEVGGVRSYVRPLDWPLTEWSMQQGFSITSSENLTGSTYNVLDNNDSTYMQNSFSPSVGDPAYITYTLFEPDTIKGYFLWYNSTSSYGPSDWEIQVSNNGLFDEDGGNPIVIATETDAPTHQTYIIKSYFKPTQAYLNNPVKYKYFRLNVTKAWSSNMRITNFTLDLDNPRRYTETAPLRWDSGADQYLYTSIWNKVIMSYHQAHGGAFLCFYVFSTTWNGDIIELYDYFLPTLGEHDNLQIGWCKQYPEMKFNGGIRNIEIFKGGCGITQLKTWSPGSGTLTSENGSLELIYKSATGSAWNTTGNIMTISGAPTTYGLLSGGGDVTETSHAAMENFIIDFEDFDDVEQLSVWDFDETSSPSTITDTNKLLHDLTVVGVLKLDESPNGTSYYNEFDGINDYCYYTDSNFDFYQESSFAMGGWFYKADWNDITTDEILMSKYANAQGYKFGIESAAKHLFVSVNADAIAVESSTAVSALDVGWHHLVYSREGLQHHNIYVDGSLFDSDTTNVSLPDLSAGGNFELCSTDSGNDKFVGRVGSVFFQGGRNIEANELSRIYYGQKKVAEIDRSAYLNYNTNNTVRTTAVTETTSWTSADNQPLLKNINAQTWAFRFIKTGSSDNSVSIISNGFHASGLHGMRVYATDTILYLDRISHTTKHVVYTDNFRNNVWYDVLCTWDGNTGAGTLQLYTRPSTPDVEGNLQKYQKHTSDNGVVVSATTSSTYELAVGGSAGIDSWTSSFKKFKGQIRDVEIYAGYLENPEQFGFLTGENYNTVMHLRSDMRVYGNATASGYQSVNTYPGLAIDFKATGVSGFLWTSGTNPDAGAYWRVDFTETRKINKFGLMQEPTYKRLKEIKLTFSDTTTQTISAANKITYNSGVNVYPNMEFIDLVSVDTDYVILEPISIYPEDSGDAYMGFREVQFLPLNNALLGGSDISTNDLYVAPVGEQWEVFNDAEHYVKGTSSFGMSGGYLTIEDHNDFDFQDEDFTIDFWMSISNLDQTVGGIISKTNNNWLLLTYNYDSDRKLNLFAGNGSWVFAGNGANPGKVAKANWIENQYYHIAITREDFVYRVFVDGYLELEYTDATNTQLSSPSVSVNIGSQPGLNRDFYGNLDEFRVVKGKALYTEDFKIDFNELQVVDRGNTPDILRNSTNSSSATETLTLASSGDSNGFVVASSEANGYEAWKAFDTATTYWRPDITSPNKLHWIMYGFDSANVINKYTVSGIADAATQPTGWILQGSNVSMTQFSEYDNNVNWTMLDIQTGQTIDASTYTFYFSSKKAYKYYRFYNIESIQGTYFNINTIKLIRDTRVAPSLILNSPSGLMTDNPQGINFTGAGALSASDVTLETFNPASQNIASSTVGSSQTHTSLPKTIKRHLQDTKLVTNVIDLGYKALNEIDIDKTANIGSTEGNAETGILKTALNSVGQYESHTVEIEGISRILRQGDLIEMTQRGSETISAPVGEVSVYTGNLTYGTYQSLNVGSFFNVWDRVPWFAVENAGMIDAVSTTYETINITQVDWLGNSRSSDADVFIETWEYVSGTVFKLRTRTLLAEANTYIGHKKYRFDVNIEAVAGDYVGIGYSNPISTNVASGSTGYSLIDTRVEALSGQAAFTGTSTHQPLFAVKFSKTATESLATTYTSTNNTNDTDLSHIVLGSNMKIPAMGDGTGNVTAVCIQPTVNTADIYLTRWKKVHTSDADSSFKFVDKILLKAAGTYAGNTHLMVDVNFYVEASDHIGLSFSSAVGYRIYNTKPHSEMYYMSATGYNFNEELDMEKTYHMERNADTMPRLTYAYKANGVDSGNVTKYTNIKKTFVIKENNNNDNTVVTIVGAIGADEDSVVNIPINTEVSVVDGNLGDIHENNSVRLAWIRGRSDVAETIDDTIIDDDELNVFRDGINSSTIENARLTSDKRDKTAFVMNDLSQYESGDKGVFYGNLPINTNLEKGIEAEQVVFEHDFKYKRKK